MFEIGAKVVKKDFLQKKRKGGKLDPKSVGPYIITAKLSKGFYSLQSVTNSSGCIKRVNGAHLKMLYSSEYQSSCGNSPNHFNQSSPHHSGQSSHHHSGQSSPCQSECSSMLEIDSAIVWSQLHSPHLMHLLRTGASMLQYEAEEDDEAFENSKLKIIILYTGNTHGSKGG